MEQWLGNSLAGFWPAMMENGFDSTELLQDLTEDQLLSMFEATGIRKMGHQFHLRNKISLLRGDVLVRSHPATGAGNSGAVSTPGKPANHNKASAAGGGGASHRRAGVTPAKLGGKQQFGGSTAASANASMIPSLYDDTASGDHPAPRATSTDAGLSEPKDPETDPSSAGLRARRQAAAQNPLRAGGYSGLNSRTNGSQASSTTPSRGYGGGTTTSSTGSQYRPSVGDVPHPSTASSSGIISGGTSSTQQHVSNLHNAAPYQRLLSMLKEGSSSPLNHRTGSSRYGSSSHNSPTRSPTLMQRSSNARLFQ